MVTLENLGLRVKEKRGEQGIRAAAKEIGISHATLSPESSVVSCRISPTTGAYADGWG